MFIYVPIVLYGVGLFYKNYIVYHDVALVVMEFYQCAQVSFLNSVRFLRYVS